MDDDLQDEPEPYEPPRIVVLGDIEDTLGAIESGADVAAQFSPPPPL